MSETVDSLARALQQKIDDAYRAGRRDSDNIAESRMGSLERISEAKIAELRAAVDERIAEVAEWRSKYDKECDQHLATKGMLEILNEEKAHAIAKIKELQSKRLSSPEQASTLIHELTQSVLISTVRLIEACGPNSDFSVSQRWQAHSDFKAAFSRALWESSIL